MKNYFKGFFMPYNDNQFFYAALFWLESLPGGEVFGPSIADRYDKLYIPMNAPKGDGQSSLREFNVSAKREDAMRGKFDLGITAEEANDFFDVCYEALSAGVEEETCSITQISCKHIHLTRACSMRGGGPGYFAFPHSIELALSAAGLDRELLPLAQVYINDDGSLITRMYKDAQNVNYPGRPDTDYKFMPLLSTDELSKMEGATWVEFEYFYRIIPLTAGETYNACYTTAAGDVKTFEDVAVEGSVMLIPHSTPGFDTLSDEELLAGIGTFVKSATVTDGAQYAVGLHDTQYEYRIEATAKPNVVHYISDKARALLITEKTAYAYGANRALLEPGDLLYGTRQSTARPVFKKSIDSGQVRVIADPSIRSVIKLPRHFPGL